MAEDKENYVHAMHLYKKKLLKAQSKVDRVVEDTKRVIDAQEVPK